MALHIINYQGRCCNRCCKSIKNYFRPLNLAIILLNSGIVWSTITSIAYLGADLTDEVFGGGTGLSQTKGMERPLDKFFFRLFCAALLGYAVYNWTFFLSIINQRIARSIVTHLLYVCLTILFYVTLIFVLVPPESFGTFCYMLEYGIGGLIALGTWIWILRCQGDYEGPFWFLRAVGPHPESKAEARERRYLAMKDQFPETGGFMNILDDTTEGDNPGYYMNENAINQEFNHDNLSV